MNWIFINQVHYFVSLVGHGVYLQNSTLLLQFLHSLGVPEKWSLVDVYGFEPDLLAITPKPVVAMILLYPYSQQVKIITLYFYSHIAFVYKKMCGKRAVSPVLVLFLIHHVYKHHGRKKKLPWSSDRQWPRVILKELRLLQPHYWSKSHKMLVHTTHKQTPLCLPFHYQLCYQFCTSPLKKAKISHLFSLDAFWFFNQIDILNELD